MAAVIATMSRRLVPILTSSSENTDVHPGAEAFVGSPVSGSITPQACI